MATIPFSTYKTLDSDSLKNKTANLWLSKSDFGSLDPEGDWHTTLNSILKNNSQENDKATNQLISLSNFDVDSRVSLVLDNGFPEIKTSNGVEYPFDKIVTSYENSIVGKVVNFAAMIKNVLGGATDDTYTGMKWNPWIRNAPSWEGTQGIFFTYTFNFALGEFGLWNAEEEVVKPILNLMAPCLPRRQGVFFTEGPWPNSNVMLGKIIRGAGENISNLIKNLSSVDAGKNPETNLDSDLANSFTGILTSIYEGFSWNIQFGNWMTFYKVIIKDCTVKFSKRVDEKGWPIQGSITLNFKGIIPLALKAHGAANLAAKFGNA